MERVDRSNDENLYQPKIHSKRIRELYQLKLSTGLPLTVLIDMVISNLIIKEGEAGFKLELVGDDSGELEQL